MERNGVGIVLLINYRSYSATFLNFVRKSEGVIGYELYEFVFIYHPCFRMLFTSQLFNVEQAKILKENQTLIHFADAIIFVFLLNCIYNFVIFWL